MEVVELDETIHGAGRGGGRAKRARSNEGPSSGGDSTEPGGPQGKERKYPTFRRPADDPYEISMDNPSKILIKNPNGTEVNGWAINNYVIVARKKEVEDGATLQYYRSYGPGGKKDKPNVKDIFRSEDEDVIVWELNKYMPLTRRTFGGLAGYTLDARDYAKTKAQEIVERRRDQYKPRGRKPREPLPPEQKPRGPKARTPKPPGIKSTVPDPPGQKPRAPRIPGPRPRVPRTQSGIEPPAEE